MNWAGLLILALAAASPAAARKKPALPAAVASAPMSAAVTVGTGVEKWRAGDYAGAVSIWQPFANAGDADAMFNIGQAYKLGRALPKDETLAREWYRKAAMKGHRPAQANLGIMLFQAGEKIEAVRWLKAAADQNEMRAQYVLGVAYWNGDGAPRSLMLAYAYLSRAAQLGLPEASNALGTLETRLSAIDRANGTAVAASLAAGDGVPAVFAGSSPIPPPAGLADAGRAEAPPPAARTAVAAPVAVAAAPSAPPQVEAMRPAQASPPPAPAPAPRAVAPTVSAVSPPMVKAPAVPTPSAVATLSAPSQAANRPAARSAAPVVTAVSIPSAVSRAPDPVSAPAKMAPPVALAVAKPAPEKPKIIVAAKKQIPVVAKPTSWRVQLGAFSQRAMAETAWKKLLAKQKKTVAGIKPIYATSGNVTKLQLGPYADEKAARNACAKIAFSGNACFVTTG